MTETRANDWPCPHCERERCRSCASRPVATQPLREDAIYWSRGRHYPDHTGQGLYLHGPEDFGNQLWGLSLDRWLEEAEQSVGSAERLRVWQKYDADRRMIEHLATSPDTVRMLQLAELRGAFTRKQGVTVRRILRQALDCRAKLLEENSVMAAYLRSKARAA